MAVIAVLAGAVVTAVEGWAAMLIIGAMHANAPEIPAIGYFASLWLVVLVNMLVGGATTAARNA